MPLKKGKKTAKKVAKSKRSQPQRGVPDSAQGAASWVAEAVREVGVQYSLGNGVEQSDKEAARYYHMAAEMGDGTAQNLLAYCYLSGEGVPQDFSEAARWLRLASDQGNAEAHGMLGALYLVGQGVPEDVEEGMRLLELGAANGAYCALVRLGQVYEQGIGVEKNLALAKQHFRWARNFDFSNVDSADFGDWLAAEKKEMDESLDTIKYTCASCEKVGDGLKVCNRCKGPRYCGVACQKKDWPDHKRVCVERGATANDHMAANANDS